MKSCGSRKESGQEMGNYELNWSGLMYGIVAMYNHCEFILTDRRQSHRIENFRYE